MDELKLRDPTSEESRIFRLRFRIPFAMFELLQSWVNDWLQNTVQNTPFSLTLTVSLILRSYSIFLYHLLVLISLIKLSYRTSVLSLHAPKVPAVQNIIEPSWLPVTLQAKVGIISFPV